MSLWSQNFPDSTGPGNPEAAEQESSKTNPTLKKKDPSAPELGQSPAHGWEFQPCSEQHPQAARRGLRAQGQCRQRAQCWALGHAQKTPGMCVPVPVPVPEEQQLETPGKPRQG